MSAFGTALITIGLLSMVVRVLLALGSVPSNYGGMLLSGTDVVSIVLVGAGLGVTLFSMHTLNERNGPDTAPTHLDDEGITLKARLLDMLATKKTISEQEASVSEPAQEVVLRGDSPPSQAEGLPWESPPTETTSFPESAAELHPSEVSEHPPSPPNPPAPTTQPAEASTDKKDIEVDAAKPEPEISQGTPSTLIGESRSAVASTERPVQSGKRKNHGRTRRRPLAVTRFHRRSRLPRRANPRASENSRHRHVKRATRRKRRGRDIVTRVRSTPTMKVLSSKKKKRVSRTSRIRKRSTHSDRKSREHNHPKRARPRLSSRAPRAKRATERRKVAKKHSKVKKPHKPTSRSRRPSRNPRSKSRSKQNRKLPRSRKAT